jgi:ribulose-phosphate 3-epimerase
LTTIRIAPSILAADFTCLGQQIADAEAAGADLIHIDVMDGRFVPNITMGPLIVAAARRSTSLPLDVHLMIVEPERYVSDFAQAGANRISVHIEASPNLHRTLGAIHESGCKAGVALNPHTPASALSEVMSLLDIILVMTVNPGFGGQRFLVETLAKIRQLRTMAGDTGREVDMGVDGGIDQSTIRQAAEAGANVMVAGTSVYNAQHSIQAGLDTLRAALKV